MELLAGAAVTSRLWRRLPLPRTALGLGDLFSGHMLRNGISRLDDGDTVHAGGLWGGEAEPHVCGDAVLCNAEAPHHKPKPQSPRSSIR